MKAFLLWLLGEIASKRKWLLLPLWILLAALAILLALTGNPNLLPSIYLAF